MAAHVSTLITIGGNASSEVAHNLRELLVDMFGDHHHEGALRSRGVRPYGNADEAEEFCQEHDLPYVLEWAEQGGVEAGSHAWRPGMEKVAALTSDDAGPTITLAKLKLALAEGRALADLVAELAIGDTSTLPPFVETREGETASDDKKLTVTGEGPNTKLTLMYRDAANYKKVEHFTLPGALSQPDLNTMSAVLDEGLYFLPEHVGLPSLSPAARDWDDDIDHNWHTIQRVVLTDEAPTLSLTVSQLVSSWPKSSKDWDS